MNLFYSRLVLFILTVICYSIPVPRNQNDAEDPTYNTIRVHEIRPTKSRNTRSGMMAPDIASGECNINYYINYYSCNFRAY